MDKEIFFVYILMNKLNTVIYIGVTNNLSKRIEEHRLKLDKDSFTAKYNVDKLVYFEQYESITAAITREKQLKNWHREWKFNLVKESNKELLDISNDLPY